MKNTFHMFQSNNLIDLGIYQMGFEHCKSCHSFGPASRNHFLFHYILSGKGSLFESDRDNNLIEHSLGADDAFLLWPGVVTTYVADEHDPWTYMWVEFDGLRARELMQIAGFSPTNPIYKSSLPDLREEMKNEMLFLVGHAQNSYFELVGHLYLFVDLLARSLTNKPLVSGNRLRHFYLQEAVAYIEEHYMDEISVEDIANNCGLNRSYFGKIFREEFGITPQHFLINYRMVKACELLLHTEKTISEISEMVGYPNQLHFSRAFKNEYGLSPRSWRSENHGASLLYLDSSNILGNE